MSERAKRGVRKGRPQKSEASDPHLSQRRGAEQVTEALEPCMDQTGRHQPGKAREHLMDQE